MIRYNIPIGISEFEKIRKNDYYYVDKTELIRALVKTEPAEITLFTRPRRFGKTLVMSMLASFFDIRRDSKALFEGLKISEDQKLCELWMNQWPVIFLSFKDAGGESFKDAYGLLQSIISQLYVEHAYLEKCAEIDESYKEIFTRLKRRQGNKTDVQISLRILMRMMQIYYGKQVILLIDEYDVPMAKAGARAYYNEMLDVIGTMMSQALKDNTSLKFSVITGCLRISKESIFTGLNNLKIISITNPMYSEHFGFTQKEVDEILAFYDRSDFADVVKRWYDGYVFGRTEVYNPWSVLNYVELIWADMTSLPRPFWANTSSNSIVKTLVEKADIKVKQEIELLIQGESIEKPIHEDITYEDIGVEESEENIWNFLFFTGYLKKVDEALRDGIRYISMSIPNEEILYIYKNTVLSWFGKKVKKKDFSELYRYVTEGEVIGLEKTISELLREGISFYDTKEAFYHGFLMGIFGGMGDYYSYSNRESGDGRYDICLKSMDVEKPVILFELKVSESFHQMEKCSLKAVEQIRMKHYEEEFLRDGYREVLCYGIAFYKKNCKITVEKQKIES